MFHLYGSTAVDLAKKILFLNEGDRLDPIRQLAKEFDTGIGTIQSALKMLIDEKAIEVEGLGKKGTFITKIEQKKLLTIADLNTVIGAMPVVYSLTFQGLETGLMKAFHEANVPLIVTQLRGAKNRLHFLRTGRCDFAIISRLSWEEEKDKGDLKLAFTFGPGSNVGDHVLLLADKNATGIKDGIKVGVDPSSHDSFQLTLEECKGKSVEFVEISYGEAYSKLLSGEIDCTIWDVGTLQTLPDNFKILPLSREKHSKVTNTNTEAVLVVHSEADFLETLIKTKIDPTIIIDTQKKVISREAKPLI